MKAKLLTFACWSIGLSFFSNGCLRNRAHRRVLTEQSQSSFEGEIFDLVNTHRVEKKLNPLIVNQSLLAAAKEHSTGMSSGLIDFGHVKFEERSQELIKRLDLKSVGENVAMGQTTSQQLIRDWLNSEEHRKNIEGDFDISAISAVRSPAGMWYFTQLFARE